MMWSSGVWTLSGDEGFKTVKGFFLTEKWKGLWKRKENVDEMRWENDLSGLTGPYETLITTDPSPVFAVGCFFQSHTQDIQFMEAQRSPS